MMFSFLPTTLSRYLMRLYTVHLFGLLGLLLFIVFLFNAVELLRRAAENKGVGIGLVMEMALLKLPDVMNVILPFSVLFAALYTFWQLSKRHELAVIRAAGISVWQFLLPIVTAAFIAGIVMVGLVNPLGAILYTKYHHLEQKFLGENDSSIVAVFDQGLWLKQETKTDYTIIHAEKIDPTWKLEGVMVLVFDKSNRLLERLDAPVASLKRGEWVITDAVVNKGVQSQHLPRATLATTLTPDQIEESFSSPRAMGFWALPGFITTLEQTGFDSTKLRIHFQSLLAQPLLYMAMIVLAACVALRPQRQGQSFLFVLIGVLAGFVIFILSNFMQAMGGSHQLPVFLAAWSPALIALLFGGAVLLTLEDG